MHLYLIRHAESQNNALPTFRRVEDPGITARGRLQAEGLAQWMQTLSVDTLITSPFLRTLQTTQAVLKARPQPLQIWDDVFERGGCYRGYDPDKIKSAPGLGRREISELILPDATELSIDNSITEKGWWDGRQPESDEQCDLRAKSVVSKFVAKFGRTDQAVILITHADFIRAMLRHMLAGVIDADLLGRLRNTGVTRLNYSPGPATDAPNARDTWQLDWLNSVSHLPSRLVTGNEH